MKHEAAPRTDWIYAGRPSLPGASCSTGAKGATAAPARAGPIAMTLGAPDDNHWVLAISADGEVGLPAQGGGGEAGEGAGGGCGGYGGAGGGASIIALLAIDSPLGIMTSELVSGAGARAERAVAVEDQSQAAVPEASEARAEAVEVAPADCRLASSTRELGPPAMAATSFWGRWAKAVPRRRENQGLVGLAAEVVNVDDLRRMAGHGRQIVARSRDPLFGAPLV